MVNFKEEFANIIDVEDFTWGCVGEGDYDVKTCPKDKLVELFDFLAGYRKFSMIYCFNFKSKVNAKIPNFSIAYVVKPRNRIARNQAKNVSRWYIFQRPSDSWTHDVKVINDNTLFKEYGFDTTVFCESDMFTKYFAEYKKHGKDFVQKDGPEAAAKLNGSDKMEAERCIRTIAEGLPYADDLNFDDVFRSKYKNSEYDLKRHTMYKGDKLAFDTKATNANK